MRFAVGFILCAALLGLGSSANSTTGKRTRWVELKTRKIQLRPAGHGSADYHALVIADTNVERLHERQDGSLEPRQRVVLLPSFVLLGARKRGPGVVQPISHVSFMRKNHFTALPDARTPKYEWLRGDGFGERVHVGDGKVHSEILYVTEHDALRLLVDARVAATRADMRNVLTHITKALARAQEANDLINSGAGYAHHTELFAALGKVGQMVESIPSETRFLGADPFSPEMASLLRAENDSMTRGDAMVQLLQTAKTNAELAITGFDISQRIIFQR